MSIPTSLPPHGAARTAATQTTDQADWERAAAAVLRRSRVLAEEEPDSLVWEKLTTTTLDGLPIPSLGTATTVAALPDPGRPGQGTFIRGASAVRPGQGWQVRTILDDPSVSAADAVHDLENGATSLWLTLGPAGIELADLDRVLKQVHLDLAPVVLDCPTQPRAAAEAFSALLDRRPVAAAPGTNLGVDLYSAVLWGSTAAPDVDLAARIAELAGRRKVLGFVVDASALHDLGASEAQELGYATAVGAAYLRLLTGPGGGGLNVDAAAALLEFRFSATVEQLPTIAKFRAARRLWARVCELSGVGAARRGQRQHAVTSRPMMTAFDPWVNMLRVTVAAFAAGVGGAQSVTVLPFDAALGRPDAFSRRIARNVSALLIEESHLGRVDDPAGGAYAVEQLTDTIARAGWAELQAIEGAGGVVAAIADGSLDARVDTVAGRREDAVARRSRPITGVSEFPNLHEQLPRSEPYPPGRPPVRRPSAAFESLRRDPAGTPVFLATLGPVAAHTTRATFAANLLAAGGVDTVPAGATSGVGAVLVAYDGQPVVCLAGTDQSYDTWGAELAAALRARGATYLVLAGDSARHPGLADLVDDSFGTGVDALAFLARVRKELSR